MSECIPDTAQTLLVGLCHQCRYTMWWSRASVPEVLGEIYDEGSVLVGNWRLKIHVKFHSVRRV